MRGWATKVAIGAFAVAALGTTGTARAADPVISVGADGTTAPNFSYKDAIRERVFVPVANVDQDQDGVIDRVAVDIIRPKESGPSLKVPSIIDPSPYYTSLGRGNETQYIHTTAAGVLDKFPLFYDNFFVPRGYAFIAAHAVGTAFSTGCPLHGGPGDVAGFKAVIDWLQGRVPGYTTVAGTTPAVADWANGKNAMIGKSYDGTFANGVAATGVDGLTTIVPISAISDWYDYSRMGGVVETTNYPRSLDNSITSDRPASNLGVVPPVNKNALCQKTPIPDVFNWLNANDGDETGDITPFWNDRDYNKDVSKVKAAVFASHGINDDNVRPDQFSRWWAGLAANNVPRKVWLHQEGHVDPFDYRRGAWVDTLHRWFDYWLQGVPNGIMSAPKVDVETSADTWATYADWPIPGTVNTDIYLAGRGNGQSGTLLPASGGATDTVQLLDNNTSEANAIASPNGSQANRLVFLTTKLKSDVHLSGVPIIDLQASLSTPQSNLAALIVDYGTANHTGRAGSDGVSNTATRTCWGASGDGADCTLGSECTANAAVDNACYLTVTKPSMSYATWRVTRGILDSSNRDSLYTATPAVVGTKYEFKFPVLPTEYTFPAGHQIGVVIMSNDSSLGANGTRGQTITLDTKASKISLPITGGSGAVTASAAFVPDTTAPVLADHADMVVNTTDPTGIVVTYTKPTATDTQDDNPTVNCTPTGGGTAKFAVGTTTITCIATDANGNAAPAKTFKVTVQFVNQADGGVSGTVPATLSLTLGAGATFASFTPGFAKDYLATMTATVTTTAADALLSVADPSSVNTGHLVNGTFFLPSPLQARATKAGTTGTALNNVGSSASPLNLLTWSGPASTDPVTVEFGQHIGANDALRTGTYSKTLTFTLSTTTP